MARIPAFLTEGAGSFNTLVKALSRILLHEASPRYWEILEISTVVFVLMAASGSRCSCARCWSSDEFSVFWFIFGASRLIHLMVWSLIRGSASLK